MISISIALLLGLAVFVLCKYAGLKSWHAAICIFCGFYLSSTSIAPFISEFTQGIFRVL